MSVLRLSWFGFFLGLCALLYSLVGKHTNSVGARGPEMASLASQLKPETSRKSKAPLAPSSPRETPAAGDPPPIASPVATDEAQTTTGSGAQTREQAVPDSADVSDRTIVAEWTPQAPPKQGAQRGPTRSIADLVVLISIDGLRPDVIFPEARTIHRLALDGASAVHSRTISKSSTLPSHASMVSGVDVDQHGLAHNSYRPELGHIQYPTIFSVAQRAGLSTALFVGKRKLQHLLNPDTVAHFEVGGVFCNKVTDIAVPHLRHAEPGVVFVHFSDPDGAGHTYGWMSDKYKQAVHRADRCVADILQALVDRGGMDRTLVLVTSDHGGHDHSHGHGKKVDRRIPWVVYGADVTPRKRIRRTVYNTDTAATIFYALGLAPPETIVGQPVLEAFGPSEA